MHCSNNLINVDIDFAKALRETCITKITKIRQKTQLLKTKHYSLILVNNYFTKNFRVVSVDSQHTLWNVPLGKNGIQLLDKRFIKKYLRYADTVYWNYNLGDTIKKYVPKSSTQEK